MFLETMKLSHSIFLVAAIITIIEILIVPANFVENPDNLVKSAFGDDLLDKISTLYLFIVIILFFFGGIFYVLEKGMERNPFEKRTIKELEAKRCELELQRRLSRKTN